MALDVLPRRGFVSLAAGAGALLLAGPAGAAVSKTAVSKTAVSRAARAVAELARWVEGKGGRLGASVLALGAGATHDPSAVDPSAVDPSAVDPSAVLAERNAERPLNPASNQKLLTAAVALAELGGGYRYRTGVYGRLEAGVARGLVLRGQGDPALDVHDLERLVRVLVAQGLKRVEGPLLVDQSRFDERYVPPAFEQQPDEWAGFRAPVSALCVDQNTVTLNVLATQAGQPARVWFHPPGAVVQRGAVATVARGRGQAVRFGLGGDSARLEARLSGHVAEGLGRLRFVRRLDDPRLVPGYVFHHLLRERSVEIGDEVHLGGEAERERLAYITSPPLGQLLDRVGKHSDNFYAEMIFKSLGGEASGQAAASKDGAARVQAWLQAIGAPLAGARITNGSGLFDANRVSPALLTHVLSAAIRDPRVGPEYLAQLAIGGVDGTLRQRFRRYPYRVRAKTGTLNDVVALSGYALSEQGAPQTAFALIVEGLPGQHYASRQKIDQVVEQLL